MAQSPSLSRPQRNDLIAAPISAFESETLAVLQRVSPRNEHAVVHIVAAMVLVAIALMAVVRLDRVVTASGRIIPSQGAIFVKPLDRAIVSAILVRPGDVVRKGQNLARLDPTFAAADLQDLEQKRASAAALVARLAAEQAGRPYAVDPASPESVLQGQIWRQRQAEYRQSVSDFDSRIASAQLTIDRGEHDAEAYAERRALASEREAAQVALQQKGFGSRSKLSAATDARIEVARLAAESRTAADQARRDVASLRAQRDVYVSKWRDDIGMQLVSAQNALADQTQNLAKARRMSDLSDLTAPADAVVLSVGKASVGSVIDPAGGASDPLFTLTPLDGNLEAEVNVEARDIGFLRPGDRVALKLDAFRFTSHGVARGVIKTISEGSFTQADNGQVHTPFYKVRVALTDVRLRNVPAGFRLIPGMTLEGDILVGRRTILSYLLEGGLRTGAEAMREP
jgi:HlyD family type I secretion membrane fusion protein